MRTSIEWHPVNTLGCLIFVTMFLSPRFESAYPVAVEDLKIEGILPRRCKLRQCRYLNNVVEQSHRHVKRRTRLAMGYGSFHIAWCTLRGIEAMHMINKGRVRRLVKDDVVGQVKFFQKLFAVAA